MSDERIKPCPFCGGEAKYIKRASNFPYVHGVVCVVCYCRASFEKDKDKAIRTWNTRKPMERIVEQLEEKASNHASDGQNYDADGWCIKASNEYAIRDAYYDAIEIVKGGGVDE